MFNRSVVVTAITSISNLDRLAQWLPAWLIPEPGTFWYGLIQGKSVNVALPLKEVFLHRFLTLPPFAVALYSVARPTGYLPVVFLEALMLILPMVLRFIGKKYIRFKTKSENDKFVFGWHFGYRVANLIIIILKVWSSFAPESKLFPLPNATTHFCSFSHDNLSLSNTNRTKFTKL